MQYTGKAPETYVANIYWEWHFINLKPKIIENNITHCLSPVKDDENIYSRLASDAIREVCIPPTPPPTAAFCTSSISRRKATVLR